MDARVDDFLNEIDEISHANPKEVLKSNNTSTCDWEECFDDTSGFPYYWNVNTNAVTWEIPADYIKWKSHQKKPKPPKTTEKHQMYKPKTQLFPVGQVLHIPDTKIYKIGETITKQNERKDISDINDTAKKIETPKKVAVPKRIVKEDVKKRRKSSDESEEDEKITLISSYGGDTESEDEVNEENAENSTMSKVIVLAKELPPRTKNTSISTSNRPLTDQPKKVTGITLLASYGESDDDEDTNKDKKDIKQNLTQQISTLFPIQQRIDASQFDSSPNQTTQSSQMTLPCRENSMMITEEQRVYQRKRRIGIELPPTNVASTRKTEIGDAGERLDGSKKGFGFNTSNTADKYSNFKSAGKMTFVKSDSDNLLLTNNAVGSSFDADLLKEKLEFLSGAKEVEISPVQIMLIQLDTLQTARLAGCLQFTYLHKWLQQTNEDISKLEKDSTPQGWLLDWDRGQKRYSYRHLHSGHVQWDYPTEEPSSSEDMDICTTPPPAPITAAPPAAHTTLEEQLKEYQRSIMEDCGGSEDVVAPVQEDGKNAAEESVGETIVAPPPPKIGRVLCPPPPILTEADMVTPPLPLMPEELPPPPPPPPEEPLVPPGIDAAHNTTNTLHQKNVPSSENLSTVLDSFYSDIAAMESSIIINNVPDDGQKVETSSSITNAADVIPVESVKKRKKLKMSQGLSMKKKGVSKLVEKWKNVQKTLD